MWKNGQSVFATSCPFFRATFDKGLPIDSNSLRWPQALHPKKQPKIRQEKDSWPSPTNWSWKICRSGSQQRHSKKDAQRRSIDEVDFAKWKRNKTAPRHTAARIRCLPQLISIACEKNVWWWIWANNTQRNYRFCGALSEKPTLQRVYYRRTTFASWIVWEALVQANFSIYIRHCGSVCVQASTTSVELRLCRGMSLIIFGLIDKCYSSHLRRKFILELEGTVTLDCLLMNTDK